MFKEAYCSYEISKLLKEKGFDWTCISYYVDYEPNNVKYSMLFEDNTTWEERCCSAPTHQMAMAWLREKHFIIVITPVLFNVEYENYKWGYDIWADDNLEISSKDCSKPLATYEEATEEALKYVLENLL